MSEARFFVVVAFRNRADLLDASLASIVDQGADWVLVGDDASEPDPDLDRVLERYSHLDGWQVTRRPQRLGVMGNQYGLIQSVPMEPQDVIVFLDGDDRFAHPEVIDRLREVYANPMIDLTYGNYTPDPPSDTCPKIKAVPPAVCRTKGQYRRWRKANGTPWNHLRTLRFRIFDAIPRSFFICDGEWLEGAADFAVMNPAMELAGGRHHMFTEPLVIYTSDRPDAEWRTISDSLKAARHHVNSAPSLRPLPPMRRTR